MIKLAFKRDSAGYWFALATKPAEHKIGLKWFQCYQPGNYERRCLVPIETDIDRMSFFEAMTPQPEYMKEIWPEFYNKPNFEGKVIIPHRILDDIIESL